MRLLNAESHKGINLAGGKYDGWCVIESHPAIMNLWIEKN